MDMNMMRSALGQMPALGPVLGTMERHVGGLSGAQLKGCSIVSTSYR